MLKEGRKNSFKRVYNIVVASIGVLSLVYYFLCGSFLRFTASALWIWLLLGIYCLAKGLASVYAIDKGIKHSKTVRIFGIIWLTFVYIFIGIFAVFECFVIRDANSKPESGLEYIIVLGAKVNGTQPSRVLSYRINAAYEYLLSNPKCKAVLSGGKGDDEEISEAECMRICLVGLGISEDRLIIESNSTSTLENITFSYELLPKGEYKIGIVSSDYHIFRAKAFFRRVFGYEAFGIPAKPDNIFWQPHNYTREFAAYAADYFGFADDLSAIAHKKNVSP